jgi:hypothetical protein
MTLGAHPDLRLKTFPGRFEVWLDGLAHPIARAQSLHDGTWVVAVRPLQNHSERAVIVESEAAAIERVQPWCRDHAWTYRPNAGKGAPLGQQPWPTP